MDRYILLSSLSRRPRGMTLIEVIAAVTMLAVLLASSVEMIRVLGSQQLAASHRAMALQTVQAVTEQLTNLSWDDVTPEAANRLSVPEVARSYLPGATLSAAVSAEDEPVAAKRLSVELRWNAPSGKPAAPLRLTTWVYPDAVAQTQ